ncbi:CRISPR-associated protein Cas4 [Persephonella sp.]
MIRQLILKKLKDREEKNYEYVRVSELGGCPLAPALRLKGYKPRIDEKTLLTLELGNGVHLNMQDILKDELEYVEQEIYDHELKIVGHPDGVIKDTIVEFKTISPWALKKAEVLPYPHHIFQLTGYMYLLRKEKGLIVYIEKSTGEIYEYPVQLTDEDIKILKAKVNLIYVLSQQDMETLNLLDKETLDVKDWQCKYCFYKHHCPVNNKGGENIERENSAYSS